MVFVGVANCSITSTFSLSGLIPLDNHRKGVENVQLSSLFSSKIISQCPQFSYPVNALQLH